MERVFAFVPRSRRVFSLTSCWNSPAEVPLHPNSKHLSRNFYRFSSSELCCLLIFTSLAWMCTEIVFDFPNAATSKGKSFAKVFASLERFHKRQCESGTKLRHGLCRYGDENVRKWGAMSVFEWTERWKSINHDEMKVWASDWMPRWVEAEERRSFLRKGPIKFLFVLFSISFYRLPELITNYETGLERALLMIHRNDLMWLAWKLMEMTRLARVRPNKQIN